MCPKMLQLIHCSHLRVDKCKCRARDVFWPGMGMQIEDIVSSWPTCSMYQRREPLLPYPTPSRPWEVSADLCELNGKHYHIVNYYTNSTSEQVTEHCKSQFARHEIPDVLISDNGPQFLSEKFHLCYQFEHHTSRVFVW